MINGNILKFGYGDICVRSDGLTQRISFQQFKPPAECGGNVPEDVEYIGEEVVLQISYEEYCEFNKQLKSVLSNSISTFSFKGYIFDFTNYNEESVKVCKKRSESAMYSYFLCMAA